ncbi:serine protease [Rhodobacteraceae bacterium LMO-12]|nr:serine protease [Rhodobacteraceae bacterium LMO-JJ12]
MMRKIRLTGRFARQWLLCALLAAFGFFAASTSLQSQNYAELFRDFDARALTKDDKRFLQTALAFEGHYNGLLDGAWGRLSQRALERYSVNEFGGGAEDWHMAVLAFGLLERYETDGWSMRHFGSLGMSLLLPSKTLIQDPPTENFVNFRHQRSSLSISIGILSKRTAQNVHDYTQGTHESGTTPYSVRKTSFAVSTGTDRTGKTLYTRSNLINGYWSTIMLSASQRDKGILNAVAASIAVGRTPNLDITKGGHLETVLKNTLTAIDELEKDKKQEAKRNVTASNQPAEQNIAKVGSGFWVSDRGHLLTNAHVISGCRNLLVDGKKAEVLEASETFDLALLFSPDTDIRAAAVFSSSPAKLNSDVTAVGYPYAGLLGGLNVTRGAVSSLKGLRGDPTTMQISAPVQSGNSGGPLLGPNGVVVGVVVSKLDSERVADALGDVPQNVNFAIRGEIAKLFLAQNGINPVLSNSEAALKPEQLAEKAAQFTVFIECD